MLRREQGRPVPRQAAALSIAAQPEAPRPRRRPLDLGLKIVGAIVVGAAIAVCIVLATGGGAAERGRSLTAETAEAGQCVDLTEQAGRIDITEADCDRSHDAEIVLTTDVSETIGGPADLDDAEAVCSELMDDADVTRLGSTDLDWGLLIDEPENLDGYDRLVCYVRSPGGRLDQPLLG